MRIILFLCSTFLLYGECTREDYCFWKCGKKEEVKPGEETKESLPGTVHGTEEPAPAPTPLVQEYWAFHKWAALGYRYDRQQFDEFVHGLPNTMKSQTTIHGRSTLTLKVGSHTQYKSAILGIHGGYGWLIDGNWDYSNKGNGVNEPFSLNNFLLGAGYTADVQGSLGWEFKVFKSPSFKFSFIPGAGYRYAHIMNWAENEKSFPIPTPPAFLSAGTSGEIRTSFPKPNQQDWFGPIVDARIRFRFWDIGQWDLYYQYHSLTLRSTSRLDYDTYLYNPASTLTLAQRVRASSLIKADGVGTQLGGTEIRIHRATGWTFGIYFEGSSTWTRSASNQIKQKTETNFPAPLVVIDTWVNEHEEVFWVNYSTSIFMGYKF
ncbi:MAG TPA: hypothetical protein VLE89_06950 [Chlamydiales bacterium]|nr:hypothetical protein [Chlamydiales bacterium]